MSLTGGTKLLKHLQTIASGMQAGETKVGFMSGATYPDGTPVAQVAFWNEFGTSKTPSRPFFRHMIAVKSEEWPKLMAGAAVYSKFDSRKTLGIVGEKIMEDLQQSIRGWQDPPNAPYTVEKKGFNKPLIDTSHMINSVTHLETLRGEE